MLRRAVGNALRPPGHEEEAALLYYQPGYPDLNYYHRRRDGILHSYIVLQ